MRMSIYSVFDVKAKVFGSPFYAVCDEVAVRNCAAMVGDEAQGGMLSKFPEDFTLYRIGSFDDDSGKLEALSPVEVVVLLVNLRKGM